jgi:hypothetical protein
VWVMVQVWDRQGAMSAQWHFTTVPVCVAVGIKHTCRCTYSYFMSIP